MNELDMLYMAAKAIGGIYDSDTDCISFDGGVNWEQWAPHEDDSDAMQLISKLQINVEFEKGKHVFTGYSTDGKYRNPIIQKLSGDNSHAVRIAVLRRAAEFGKAMP